MPAVLLVLHPERAEARTLAEAAREWWDARGYAVTIVGDARAEPVELGGGDGERFDFAISLGGDGTMLRAVRLAAPGRTPVLGVNLGRMGYLTEVEPSGMLPALERLAAGDYSVEERMTLDVEIEAAATPGGARLLALNEAIVERVAAGHTIRVGVDISGKRFLTYVADGLLVATPTGSTAYNLSARGPVVSPALAAMIFTPVAPHLVFDRSLVLGPTETVTFELLAGRPAVAVLDGVKAVPLAEGDRVSCRAGSRPARLVVFKQRDFHAVLRSRFQLADR